MEYLVQSVASSAAWFTLGSLTTWAYLHGRDTHAHTSRKDQHR